MVYRSDVGKRIPIGLELLTARFLVRVQVEELLTLKKSLQLFSSGGVFLLRDITTIIKI